MDNKQNIKTPEGVTKLMQELWLRRQSGSKQLQNNVFWVDFTPLTEEEKAAELKAAKEKDDKPEDLFGAWI